MEVKKIDDTQITNAIDLIWQTFLQFEAPDYSEEGVKSFQEFIENKEIVKTLEFWGAYDEERLKGVIATNENRKHICCFFVKAQYQRQGIGRKLWNFLRENSSSKTITVNSSPYAVPVYHKLGFIDTDTEQLSDGIRYIPMKQGRVLMRNSVRIILITVIMELAPLSLQMDWYRMRYPVIFPVMKKARNRLYLQPARNVHLVTSISIRPTHTKRQVNLPGSVTQQDIVLVRKEMRTPLYVHQILTQTVRSQELKMYL